MGVLSELLSTANGSLGEVIFNRNYTGEWWHQTVGSVMDSKTPIILQITGDTEDVADNAWLKPFISEQCHGNGDCSGAIWASKYPDSCCDESFVIEDQVDKRNVFVDTYKNKSAGKRPLMRLSYQFTYPPEWAEVNGTSVEGDNLRVATADLRKRAFDFYNQIVKKDGTMTSFPIANIVGMDYVSDCPDVTVALGVCGSIQSHDEHCTKTNLPNTTCLQKTFEVPTRDDISYGGAMLFIAFVVYFFLLCVCGFDRCLCEYFQGRKGHPINYLIIVPAVFNWFDDDGWETGERPAPPGRKLRAQAREINTKEGGYTLLTGDE